ncbi:MAG: hypothetical protein M0Z69_06445 [Actinomycetota bacterium]|nr:hypothetical protein [Actinomycetota bacterium]
MALAADLACQGMPLAEDGPAPVQPAADAPANCAGFFRTCRLSLVVGLGLPLLLGPITSWPGDVYVWYERVVQASVGVPLYTLPGFSYPPVWGYVLGAFGFVAHVAHLEPTAFGSPNNLWLRVTSGYLPPVITSLSFDAAFKAVLVAMDLESAWFLWRLVLVLHGDRSLAKRAVTLFLLSPVVLVSVGLHGAFDVIVPLLVLASLLARLEGHSVATGALVALGALAKIEPAFLALLMAASWWWPLDTEATTGKSSEPKRLAHLAAFAAGGLSTSAALLAPVVADHNLGSFMIDVFTRSAGPTNLGGLGLSGLLQLPGLEPVLNALAGRENHDVGVVLEAIMLAASLGAAVAWSRSRRRTGAMLVTLSSVVTAVTLLVSPVTQPQYLVWLVGPLCALACTKKALRRFLWALGVAGAVYLLGSAGPLLVLAPLLARLGLLHVLLPSIQLFTRSPVAFGLAPGLFATDAARVLSVAALVGVIVSVVRTGLHETRPAQTSPPGAGPPPVFTVRPEARGRRLSGRALAATAVVLAGCELLSAIPLPSALPSVMSALPMSTTRGGVVLDLSAPSSDALRADVVAFASSGTMAVRRVVLYEDIAYPDSGSTWAETVGVQDNLEALATAARLGWQFSSLGTNGLRRLLLDLGGARGTVVVMTTGVMPRAVFSRSSDLVRPWLHAGGVLVWTGDVPGYYASGPSAQVATFTEIGSGSSRHHLVRYSPSVQVLGLAGTGRLLGHAGDIVIGRWYALASRPSPWASALHLVYPYAHAGPALDQLSAWHATALGYESSSSVSIAFLHIGQGGILLFGGFTFASIVASDTARILESGCLAAIGPPAAASLRPRGRAVLTVAVPAGGRQIDVMTFNPLVPQVARTEIALGARTSGS